MGNSKSKQRSASKVEKPKLRPNETQANKIERTNSHFASALCLNVHGEIIGFLQANDQAQLRATAKHFCTVFNHAFQRGYVAAAIHEGYVEKFDVMHEDGDDGNPLLRVAPVDLKGLFWKEEKEMHRSETDKDATLFVNVRLVLGSGKTVLEVSFLRATLFKAVHLHGTETLEKIEDGLLCQANVQTFTMTTPCPKLREIGNKWLSECENLTHFDVSGCCALERVGGGWLYHCPALKSANFKGCRQLQRVGDVWMVYCSNLSSVDLGDLVALEGVGDYWLSGCRSLLSIDLSPCRGLHKIGDGLLSNCNVLKTIDLRGCLALEGVGERFLLKGTLSLQRIFVSQDQKLPAHVTKSFEDKLVVMDAK